MQCYLLDQPAPRDTPSARMRSEGYGNLPWPSVSLCVAVYDYSRTTGNETDYERYRRLQCNKRLKNKMDILPDRETGTLTIVDVAWPHACVYVHARERSHHHHSLEGPSHPSLTEPLPYFHRRFHTSIVSALPYFHPRTAQLFAHAQSIHSHSKMPGCARLAHAHEVKSWMASNRQGQS